MVDLGNILKTYIEANKRRERADRMWGLWRGNPKDGNHVIWNGMEWNGMINKKK